MAHGPSKVATRVAASSVPFVPSIGKSRAATGTAIVMIISKRIIKRIGVNPFSVFTDLKTKGAVKTVYATIESFEVFFIIRTHHFNEVTLICDTINIEKYRNS
jgi:hypothetical protein